MKIHIREHEAQEMFFSMLNFGDVFRYFRDDKDYVCMKIQIAQGPKMVGYVRFDTNTVYVPATDFKVIVPKDCEMGVEW